MTGILPQIPLLLLLVTLFLAPVRGDGPTITCDQAVMALNSGKNRLLESTKGLSEVSSSSSSSTPIYSCLKGSTALANFADSITYLVRDKENSRFSLEVIWNRVLTNKRMVSHRNWAQKFFESKKHSNLQEILKLVQKNVGNDGEPFEGTINAPENGNWAVYYTLLEYGNHGTLEEFLKTNSELSKSLPWVGHTFFGIADAVVHLYELGIVHTNIKLGNVFLDIDFKPKLFLPCSPVRKDTPGSFRDPIWFAAPEVLLMHKDFGNPTPFTWSEKQATFLLGVLLYQMLYFGRLPFGDGNILPPGSPKIDETLLNSPDPQRQKEQKQNLYKMIKEGNFRVWLGISFEFVMVLHGSLQLSEANRWEGKKITDAFRHFSSIKVNPWKPPVPWDGTKLTIETPIGFPNYEPATPFMVSTIFELEKPEIYEKQDFTVFLDFNPQFPWFLYKFTPVRRFNLVR